MASNWIGGAIKHPGALHRDLHVAMGQAIPADKMAKARSGADGPKTQQRANLASELKHFHTGKDCPHCAGGK